MVNDEPAVRIHFRCPELDLRDIAIVSQGLHRAFNEAFAQGMELHRVYGRQRYFLRTDDPLLVSLEVTELSLGSLSARTRVRLQRDSRNLTIGVAGSLIASAIIAIGIAAQRDASVDTTPPREPPQQRPVDVGPHIRDMTKQLAASGKPWELTVEDQASGTKVVIRSDYYR